MIIMQVFILHGFWIRSSLYFVTCTSAISRDAASPEQRGGLKVLLKGPNVAALGLELLTFCSVTQTLNLLHFLYRLKKTKRTM